MFCLFVVVVFFSYIFNCLLEAFINISMLSIFALNTVIMVNRFLRFKPVTFILDTTAVEDFAVSQK